jgi:hypothetical protein
MPRMAGQVVAVAAGAVVPNVLAGQLEEFVRRPSAVRFMACGSAVGFTGTAIIGNSIIVQDQLVSFANRYPVVPDDTLAEHGAKPGTRLIMTFRNTSVGVLTITWVVDISPLA